MVITQMVFLPFGKGYISHPIYLPKQACKYLIHSATCEIFQSTILHTSSFDTPFCPSQACLLHLHPTLRSNTQSWPQSD